MCITYLLSLQCFLCFGNKNRKSIFMLKCSAFLEYSLNFKPGVHVYNYIDKPDLDMNSLISTARWVLFGKKNVGIRLPRAVGIGLGHSADFASKLLGKPLPVSCIRVKKFLGTTQFSSSVAATGFIAPVDLEDAIDNTLRYEFIEDNSAKAVFLTE